MKKANLILLGGDLLTLLLVTMYGFASHQELDTAGSRILTTFVPLALSWLFIAPLAGLYDLETALDPRQIWRPFWAMVLAGPMAAWLRAVILGVLQGVPTGLPILPIFVVVIGGVSALALLAWRSFFLLAARRMSSAYG